MKSGVAERIDRSNAARKQAQALYNEAMSALASDADYIVAEIERTIEQAAPRIMRRHLLRRTMQTRRP